MSSSDGNNLSKKISALESSGFSPNEINEVLKRLGTVARVADNDIYVETLGSWMLNYAIPSILVLGTGALFFLLTGGEDEPSIASERPCDSDSALAIGHDSNDFQEEEILEDDHGLSQSLGRNNRSVNTQNNSSASGESKINQNTGRVRDSRISNDRPFRDPSSYVAEDDAEYGRKLDNMYSEASEQWLKEVCKVWVAACVILLGIIECLSPTCSVVFNNSFLNFLSATCRDCHHSCRCQNHQRRNAKIKYSSVCSTDC
jgi:hypothetical protein